MLDRTPIPMPTPQEKGRAVDAILDQALPQRSTLWGELRRTAGDLPLGVLFFGVGDCLFLACLLTGLCLFPAALAAGNQSPLGPLLFLFSPLLYAALQVLTQWKEAMSGTLEWKKTCRLSFRTLTAWRMLLFGGAAVALLVPADLLLWQLAGRPCSLVWMLALSCASLFLYAALALGCQGLARVGGLVLPPLVWLGAGCVLLVCPPAALWLERLPLGVFLLLAAGGLGAFLWQLDRAVSHPRKGGSSYAVC